MQRKRLRIFQDITDETEQIEDEVILESAAKNILCEIKVAKILI